MENYLSLFLLCRLGSYFVIILLIMHYLSLVNKKFANDLSSTWCLGDEWQIELIWQLSRLYIPYFNAISWLSLAKQWVFPEVRTCVQLNILPRIFSDTKHQSLACNPSIKRKDETMNLWMHQRSLSEWLASCSQDWGENHGLRHQIRWAPKET